MPSDDTRRLVLLRHAKADWPDLADVKRPLAARGRRDAPRTGAWLRDRGCRPDLVVCSVATRTRQTWALVAPELGGSPEVRFESRAYDASALTLLYLARELPPASRTALMIGHNPALAELAASLAAGHLAPAFAPDGAAVNGRIRFPTAAVAVLEFGGDWADLAPGQARMTGFTTPAGA